MNEAGYEAYLIVVPGTQLAAIYDRWGARLLEQNVRVFLQARGGVNKGMRNTIENDPTMFFAYNNGVTATAEAVQTRTDGGATAYGSSQFSDCEWWTDDRVNPCSEPQEAGPIQDFRSDEVVHCRA